MPREGADAALLATGSFLATLLLARLVLASGSRSRSTLGPTPTPTPRPPASESPTRTRTATTGHPPPASRYEVRVAVERFKFNAAHFIAFPGFRERLHGHNYTVGVDLVGGASVGPDGYLVDFGDVKRVVTALCKELNERFLLPERSDALVVERTSSSWVLTCEDGARFEFPADDVAPLPIKHSSAEELASSLWTSVVDAFSLEMLRERGVIRVDVSVAEAPNQQATFRGSVLDASFSTSASAAAPCPCACPCASHP